MISMTLIRISADSYTMRARTDVKLFAFKRHYIGEVCRNCLRMRGWALSWIPTAFREDFPTAVVRCRLKRRLARGHEVRKGTSYGS